MPGIDNYKEQWLDVIARWWIFFAFVKSGNMFTVYENTTRIFSEILPKTPTGLSINDQSLFGTKALLDEVKLFDVAKEPREIFELQKDTDVEYFIDGKNFKEFGVFVSKVPDWLDGWSAKKPCK